MTGPEFTEALDVIGWSQRRLADYLDVNHTTVRRWAVGTGSIPPNVAAWLKKISDFQRRHLLPEGWARASEEGLKL